MRNRILRGSLALIALFPVACASRNPAAVPHQGFNVFSKDQDIQLGREAAAQVRQQVDIVPNAGLQNYIRKLGSHLASMPEAGNFPYEFTLINDRNINAFALPGGPIFINSGTVAAADNEAQLAGVIAHEISHVALRHSTNQASKANLIQLPAALASAALGQGSLLGQLGQVGLSLGLNSVLLKYSRDAESQADNLGARILSEAGYNPIEMARFFEKLQAQGGPGVPQFLSDHPSPGNREKAIQEVIRTLPQKNYTAGTGEFASAKQEVAQLPPPSKPRRLQESRNSAAFTVVPNRPGDPSGEFKALRARTYTLSYPADWRAFSDNDSAMVTLAPPDGLVPRNGGVALGYGAVANYYFPGGLNGPVNLKSATQELVTRLGIMNRGLKLEANPKKTKVDGYPAMITYLSGASPYGGKETNVLLTVERPEGLFYMVFVAPATNYRSIQPLFDKMQATIRFPG